MDFSNYLIISDMDGTLLDRSGKIPARTLEALARFIAGGGHFTVATGRPHTLLSPIPQPEKLLTAPAVMVNGTYLYDFGTKKCLKEQYIAPEIAAEMLDFIREECEGTPCRVATPDAAVRTATPYGLMLEDMEVYTMQNVKIQPFAEWRVDDWQKIVFRDEPVVLARIREKAQARFHGRLDIFLTGRRFLEMQSAGCSKATGVESLRDLFGAKMPTVIACGDFENDIDMLRAADIAVAPANAIESVKAVADYVLCDCEDGLIADVIEGIEAGRIVAKRA